MNLELMVMKWLRFEKRCLFVINERSPLYTGGNPDVLGVSRARESTEVEIKRSMADFRRNKEKNCIKLRDTWISRWPKQFYFAVPENLSEKVLAELPEWAGLLSVDHAVTCVKRAPANKAAKKLTIKQCAHFAELMANQIMAQAQSIEGFQDRFFCDSNMDELYKNGWWTKSGERVTSYTNFQI